MNGTQIRELIKARSTIDAQSGCWLWSGKLFNKGYGRICRLAVSKWCGGRTRNVLAHRASYRAFRGEIADGLLVCHKCDVPACVNPDHLFVGTVLDNTTDSIRKGRRPSVCTHDLSMPGSKVRNGSCRGRQKMGCRQCSINRYFRRKVARAA